MEIIKLGGGVHVKIWTETDRMVWFLFQSNRKKTCYGRNQWKSGFSKINGDDVSSIEELSEMKFKPENIRLDTFGIF